MSRTTEILADLIAFPTVTSDIAAQDVCLAYIRECLQAAGLQVIMHTSNGVPSLVAQTQSGIRSKLILQAHLDVVPGSHELFELQPKDDKLCGRGSYDMKFAAACFIAAAETLQARNHELDYAIMLTCDEEIGGKNGVAYLLKTLGYTADICLLPDGGTDWAIEENAKGIWFVRVDSAGTAAHGSRPWEGDNASHKLLDFLQTARELFPAGEPHETTLVISELAAGSAINQVPDTAHAILDIRYLDDDAKTEVQTRLYELAAQHSVTLTTHTLVPASNLDISIPSVLAWKEAAKFATGRETIGHCLSLGASDAQYFSQAGIPTIATRPLGGCPHGPNEWIDKASLEQFYKAICDFVPRVALVSSSVK